MEALAIALLAFRLFAIAPREMHSMSLVSPDALCERVSFALDELQHCKFARRTPAKQTARPWLQHTPYKQRESFYTVPVLCAFVILATLATALLDTRCARGKADAETLQATRAVTTTNRRSAALRVRSTADLILGMKAGETPVGVTGQQLSWSITATVMRPRPGHHSTAYQHHVGWSKQIHLGSRHALVVLLKRTHRWK